MKKMILKLVIAVIVSPLILAILVGTITNGFPFFQGVPLHSDYFRFMGLVYYFSFIGAVVIGVPVTLLLRRFRYTRHHNFLLSGFMAVLIYSVLASLLTGTMEYLIQVPMLLSVLMFGGCGAVVASLFWFFVIYSPLKSLRERNIDLTSQPESES